MSNDVYKIKQEKYGNNYYIGMKTYFPFLFHNWTRN
jgi:hypothetical protein